MAFAARIFTKLSTAQRHHVHSYTEFRPKWSSNKEIIGRNAPTSVKLTFRDKFLRRSPTPNFSVIVHSRSQTDRQADIVFT
jgi:hypothetical protein